MFNTSKSIPRDAFFLLFSFYLLKIKKKSFKFESRFRVQKFKMTTIFVAKLDFGVTDAQLRQAFESYGAVSKVTIAKDKETEKPRGFAFVEMPNDQEADAAIQGMDGYSFNGRNCVVKKADDRGDGGNNRPQRDGNFQNRPRNNDNRERSNNRDFQNRPPREGGYQNRDSRPPRDNDGPQRDHSRVDRSLGDVPSEPILPTRTVAPKKVTPKKDLDTTQDGKNKKTKLNPYKKSGKDSVNFEDDFEDDDIDLFGFNDDEEDDIDDEIASQYLINSDDDDEDWDDEDYDDEDWDEEDEDDEY